MGKPNRTPIVTRSKSKSENLGLSTSSITLERRRRIKIDTVKASTAMEEQIKQLQLEQAKLEKQQADFKKKQDEWMSQRAQACDHDDLVKQIQMLQAEKEAQTQIVNQLRLSQNVSQSADPTNRLIGSLVTHFQSLQLDIKAPKFSDEDSQNPLEFLSELENYFTISNVPEAQRLWVVNSILSGRAKIWYDINKDSCNTFGSFKRAFKEEFYSVQHQVKVKSRWAARRYKSQDGSLRSYFGKQNREAKYFEPKSSTYEINYAIVQQLPYRVRDILAAIDFSNTKLILSTLANIDSSFDEKENEKTKNQAYNKKPSNSNGQSQSQSGSFQFYNNKPPQISQISFSGNAQNSNQQPNYNAQTANYVYRNNTQPSFQMPNTRFPPPVQNNQINTRYNNQHLN